MLLNLIRFVLQIHQLPSNLQMLQITNSGVILISFREMKEGCLYLMQSWPFRGFVWLRHHHSKSFPHFQVPKKETRFFILQFLTKEIFSKNQKWQRLLVPESIMALNSLPSLSVFHKQNLALRLSWPSIYVTMSPDAEAH